jgi:polar amino acid transport system permease protein
MNRLVPYVPLITKGIVTTLGAWLCAAVCSFVIGLLLGVMSSEHLKNYKTSWIIKVYTFVAKGIPAYVQILIAYFVLPSLFGFSIQPFVAACGALAFCSGGYVTEIVKAGIDSVPKGQWNAAFVLGYPRTITLKNIILPQALRTVLSALLGEFEQLLKSTSLLATIGVTELTRAGQNIISRELNPFTVYIMIALLYLVFSGVIRIVMYFLQRRKKPYGVC